MFASISLLQLYAFDEYFLECRGNKWCRRVRGRLFYDQVIRFPAKLPSNQGWNLYKFKKLRKSNKFF